MDAVVLPPLDSILRKSTSTGSSVKLELDDEEINKKLEKLCNVSLLIIWSKLRLTFHFSPR